MPRWSRRRKLRRQMDARLKTRSTRGGRNAARGAPLPSAPRRRWRKTRFVFWCCRKLTVTACFLVVAAVVFAAGALLLIDVEGAESEIAAALEAATGRKVEIRAKASLRAGTAPTLRLDGVRIANAPWGSNKFLLRARRMEAQIAILPLLTGKIELRRLLLIGPVIQLEIDKKGRRNWVFESGSGGTGSGIDLPVDELLRGIGTIRIIQGIARYNNRKTGERTAIDLSRLSVTRNKQGRLVYTLKGQLNGRPITARGSVRPPLPHQKGRYRTWLVDVAGRAGGSAINADGIIIAGDGHGRAEMVFAIAGRNLEEFGSWFDADFPRIGPYKIAGKMVANGPDWEIHDVQIQVGRTRLSGAGTIAPLADPVHIRTKLTGTVIDVDTVLDDLAGKRRRGRHWSEDRVALGGLGGVDATIRILAGRLQVGSLGFERLDTRIRLSGGRLALAPFTARIGDGTVAGTIDIRPYERSIRLAAKFRARRLPMARLSNVLLGARMVRGAGELDAELTARGETVGDLIASLGGSVGLVMGRGRLESGQLRTLSAGVMGAISPWAPSNRITRLNCIVSRFDIRRGIATSKATVVDTVQATILAEGQIDLARGRMAMTITPRAKDVSLMCLMVPIRVSGPIANPSAFPDPRRLATGTIGVIAGLAGTVFSAIGFGDSARDGRKTCAEALARAGKGS